MPIHAQSCPTEHAWLSCKLFKRSEEHTSELQSLRHLVCRLLLEKKKEDITLEVGENEFVTLVGPSGCGKSTLLKLVYGLVLLTSGQIYIRKQAVRERVPERDLLV